MTRCGFLLTMGLSFCALSFLTDPSAEGGVLTVEGPTINWNGGPSPKMTLSIKNPSTSPQSLIGYRLDLYLEADQDAEGTLLFNTATTAEINYLFEGNSLLDPTLLTPDDTIEDFTDFVSGELEEEKAIAPGASFGLITIEFDVSDSELSGLFYVKLRAFAGDFSPWYLPPGEDADETYFANAPPLSVAAIMGIIAINVEASAVPEPSTHLLFLSATALLLADFARRVAMRH